jgi:hypothetical protein
MASICKNVCDFGEGLECQIRVHQSITEACCVDARGIDGEIKGVRSDLPEIRMTPLGCAEPRVLKLLVPPQADQPLGVLAEVVAESACRRGKVEQRPVGIEDAGLCGAEALQI